MRLPSLDAGIFWQGWSTQAASGGAIASGSWALEGVSSATAPSGRRAEMSALPTLAGSSTVSPKRTAKLATSRLPSGLGLIAGNCIHLSCQALWLRSISMHKTGCALLGQCKRKQGLWYQHEPAGIGATVCLSWALQSNPKCRPQSSRNILTAMKPNIAILALSGLAVSRMGSLCDRCPSPEALQHCRVSAGSGHLL